MYSQQDLSTSRNILVDDTEDDPILDFKEYSETIANLIKSSNPKFCIAILGEWGIGKTTLMRLVEKKLRENMFRWDYVPGICDVE